LEAINSIQMLQPTVAAKLVWRSFLSLSPAAAAELSCSAAAESRMKVLNVQLQPDRSPTLDVSATVARLRALASDSWVSQGEDDGRHVNIGFGAADPAELWAAVQEHLRADAGLAGAAIVVCQGECGWDDYLLLHHFDPTEPLDQLSSRRPNR
jgi:hypothetical protein